MNIQFFTNRMGENPQRAPRIAEDFAQNYLRLLQRGKSLKWDLSGDSSIFQVCTDALGPLRPEVRCERYTVNAVGHWLSDRLDSPASIKRYITAFGYWVRATGLRRLDHQVAVTHRYLLEYRDYLTQQSWAARSINTHLQILRSWFTWLRDLGLLERSPWRRDLLVHVDKGRLYHVNRVGHTRRRLTIDQANAFLAYAWQRPPRECLALVLLVVAGLRRSEVRDLTHSDLFREGEQLCLSVRGKGNKTRPLPLEPVVVKAVERHLAHHACPGRPAITGALLRSVDGGPIHSNTIGRWVLSAGRAIDRPDLTPHELRRTYATLLRDLGAPLEVTQVMLGHSSPVLTREFYDVGDRRWTGGTGLTVPVVA